MPPEDTISESDDQPYIFKEKPPAKSSTNVAAIPGRPVCPSCGCKRDLTDKKNCRCICHQWKK